MITIGVGLCQLAWPGLALGCPVCFGEVDAAPAQAINAGIAVMLAIVAAVLAAFAFFVVRLARRARMYGAAVVPEPAAPPAPFRGAVRC